MAQNTAHNTDAFNDDIITLDDQQMENANGGLVWFIHGAVYGGIACLVHWGVTSNRDNAPRPVKQEKPATA